MRDYSRFEKPKEEYEVNIHGTSRTLPPVITYKDRDFSYEDVRDGLWEFFKEDYGLDERKYTSNPPAFAEKGKDLRYSRKVDDAFDEYFDKNIRGYLDEIIATEEKR